MGMIFLVRLVMRREYFLFGLMMLFLDQVVIRWEVLIGFWSGGSARLEIVFDADEDDEEDEIVFEEDDTAEGLVRFGMVVGFMLVGVGFVVNGLLFKFEFGSGVGLGSGIGSGFVEIEFKGEEIEPGFG